MTAIGSAVDDEAGLGIENTPVFSNINMPFIEFRQTKH
jgi:hypothetical protein